METLELQQTSELQVIAKRIDAGLVAFEKRKSELNNLKSEADGLKIESIEDKETITSVSVIRKKLKSARVDIAKEGKSMRDPLTAVSRVISEKEKELIDIIEPTEKELQRQEKWVEEEKEKIRQAEIAAENNRIQTRIDQLAKYGYQIDYTDIKKMSDETFGKYLDAARIQFEKEEEDKKEAERIKLEQLKADYLEKEKERERLVNERKELEELRKKQAQAQQIIDEQNKKIEQEKKALRIQRRRNQLKDLGCVDEFGNDTYTYKGRVLVTSISDVDLLDEQDWDQIIKKIPLAIRDYEAELAKAAEEAKQKALQEAKDAFLAKEEKDRKEKEAAERKAARQPDKVKLKTYVDAIKEIPVPEMKTGEGKNVLLVITDLINQLPTHLETL